MAVWTADRHRAISEELAESIRAHAQTRAARRELWQQTYEARRFSDEGITAIRTACDMACTHLDAESDRLHGDIEALRVELGDVQFQAGVLNRV